MKIKLKMILLFFVSFTIGAVGGSYTTLQMTQSDSNTEFVNYLLYDLNIEMDLLEHWNSKYINDSIMEEKIKHLIINKMIIMSTINPKIGDLEGVPLEALHRLIIFSKDNKFHIEKYNKVSDIVLNYLKSVEKDANLIIEKRKKIFRKPLK